MRPRITAPVAILVSANPIICINDSSLVSQQFWWGFEAFGLASAITPFLIALISPGVVNLYIEFAMNIVEHLFSALINNPATQGRLLELVQGDLGPIIIEFAIFLPQFFVAVAGGLLASLIGRLWGKAHSGCLTKMSSAAEPAASISVSSVNRPALTRYRT